MKNLLFLILYGLLLFPGHFACSSDPFEIYLGTLSKEQLKTLRKKFTPASRPRIKIQNKLERKTTIGDNPSIETYLATLSQKQLEKLLNYITEDSPSFIDPEVVRRITMYSNNTKQQQSPRISEPSTAAPSSSNSPHSVEETRDQTQNLDRTINLFDEVKPFLPSETEYRRSAESIQAIEITKTQKPQPDTEDMLRYMNKLRTSCPNLYGQKINDFFDAVIKIVPENLEFNDDGAQNVREALQHEKSRIITPTRFVHDNIVYRKKINGYLENIDERQYIKQADGTYEPKNVYEVDIPGSISGFALWLEMAMRPIPLIRSFLSEYYSQLLEQNANTPSPIIRGAWLDAKDPNVGRARNALDATTPHDGYLRNQPAHANRPQRPDATTPHAAWKGQPQNLDRTNPHDGYGNRASLPPAESPTALPAATINFAELAGAYPQEIKEARLWLNMEQRIGDVSEQRNPMKFLVAIMVKCPILYRERVVKLIDDLIMNIPDDIRIQIKPSIGASYLIDKKEIKTTWTEGKNAKNYYDRSLVCLCEYIASIAKSNATIERLINATFEQIAAELEPTEVSQPQPQQVRYYLAPKADYR